MTIRNDGVKKRFPMFTHASVVIVSHSMEDMARYCDDVIVMNGGKIAMHGEKDKIFSRGEELRAIGLDVPQISELVLELERYGIFLGREIYTVDAAYAALLKLFGGDSV